MTTVRDKLPRLNYLTMHDAMLKSTSSETQRERFKHMTAIWMSLSEEDQNWINDQVEAIPPQHADNATKYLIEKVYSE